MKITSLEEYGLRCLLQLSQADEEKGMTVREIASLEGLSPAYVEKLLRLLGKAGLIHSVRGMHGGYLLSRKPNEINLGAVVRALGSVMTTQEICDRHPGNRASCVHIEDCCIRSAWATLTGAIENFMDKVYISDLIGPEAKVRRTLQRRVETPFTV
ncbi:MAG: Rrf2 family transcriptional regulator [Candidatus Omnitrophica bacterium]|nr:Rrf2 family transcriptional regulator [Candidatus Omnitrophota bacterium]